MLRPDVIWFAVSLSGLNTCGHIVTLLVAVVAQPFILLKCHVAGKRYDHQTVSQSLCCTLMQIDNSASRARFCRQKALKSLCSMGAFIFSHTQ